LVFHEHKASGASWPTVISNRVAVELNETAHLQGYEDANSFFRAFHWEGTSPGEWRARHRTAQVEVLAT
jgi:AraC-like DNA-binding protein